MSSNEGDIGDCKMMSLEDILDALQDWYNLGDRESIQTVVDEALRCLGHDRDDGDKDEE